jgi:pimeloyl-ACP methyl ester carboxylesterase
MRRVLLFAGFLIGAFLLWFVFKSYTMPVFTANGIAELKAITVNGDRQYILIRGEDRAAPILFFLHGGPGMSAMYLGHAFQRPLEKDFVVVHWDQRGAGKSFHADVDPKTLSTSQLIMDAEYVIAHVQEMVGRRKVILVGHSHGTYLGVILASRRPDLVAAYVGIGQIADEAAPVQDAFLRGKLKELGLPEDTKIDGRNREDLLFRTGSELVNATSPWPIIATGFQSTEYSLFDGLNVPKGPQLYAKHMRYDVLTGAPMNEVTQFTVPVYFIMGRFDMVTPTSQAREYFDKLSAPTKRWYEFKNSAHFPFFEEPDRFAQIMREIKSELTTMSNPPGPN